MTSLELQTVDSTTAPLTSRIRMLCILFFFSGFPALIYQLTWQRSLFRIFGKSEAATIKVDLGMETPKMQAGRLYYLSSTYVH